MDKNLFTKEELAKGTIYQEWKKRLKEARQAGLANLSGDEATQLFQFVFRAETSFKNYGGEIASETVNLYHNLIIETKCVLLHLLTEKEIEEIFESHFLFGWKLGIDFLNRLAIKIFSTIPFLENRNIFLKSLRQVLLKNKEMFGTLQITVEGKTTLPYLSLWLKDWENMYGKNWHSQFQISEYLIKSPNTRLISMEERKTLRDILTFYEQIKLPVDHPMSFAAYSLNMFGIKSVGSGLQQRFIPEGPDAVKAYKEYRRETMEKHGEDRQKTTSQTAVAPKIVKEPFRLVKNAPQREAEEEMVQKSTAPAPKVEEFEEDFGAKKTLGTGDLDAAIAKLNSAEGLADMTVGDFRLYSTNPKEAARFIFHKTRKMVIDAPADRTKIRQNFSNCELYKLYLSQGKEALDTKNSISLVAEQRKKQGRPYLSEEEYKAIAAVGRAI